jgi:hypothetical protein
MLPFQEQDVEDLKKLPYPESTRGKGRPTPKRKAPTAPATAASKHALDALLGINAGASSPKENARYRGERRLKNRTARRSRRLNRK